MTEGFCRELCPAAPPSMLSHLCKAPEAFSDGAAWQLVLQIEDCALRGLKCAVQVENLQKWAANPILVTDAVRCSGRRIHSGFLT